MVSVTNAMLMALNVPAWPFLLSSKSIFPIPLCAYTLKPQTSHTCPGSLLSIPSDPRPLCLYAALELISASFPALQHHLPSSDTSQTLGQQPRLLELPCPLPVYPQILIFCKSIPFSLFPVLFCGSLHDFRSGILLIFPTGLCLQSHLPPVILNPTPEKSPVT